MATRLRGIFPSQTSSYAGKTENIIADTFGPGFGIGSVITNNGVGILSAITNQGVGTSGEIQLGFGVGSVITNNGIGKTGLITNDGVGKEGDI
jgi:hypothetical protein